MIKQVIVYSMDDCVECEFVKRVLTEEKVPFEVRDVRASEKYQQEVEEFGFLGVPVTVWENRAIKGFTPELQDIIDRAKNG
ncbi:glutaredoxin family protein [Domibacillus sp. 8LH]|uniref:glutaredoxin family protein n=1 Tax=Domibacillus sp. 8LH TaxID=3073900 RepID=UPI0031763FC6